MNEIIIHFYFYNEGLKNIYNWPILNCQYYEFENSLEFKCILIPTPTYINLFLILNFNILLRYILKYCINGWVVKDAKMHQNREDKNEHVEWQNIFI